MNLTVLDKNTVTVGDVDFSVIDNLCNVKYYDVVPAEELIETIKDSDAIICNKAIISKEIIESCPKLKYIGLFATGYNNIDLNAAREHNIVVCNAPNYSTESVVQQVFALLLNIAGSVNRYIGSVENGEWISSTTFSYFPYPIVEIAGKTLGIVGYGNIGKRVAQVAQAFGMNVIVSTRTVPQNSNYEFTTINDLFARSDFISLNCPLTDQTRELVNKKTLSLMKKNAFIINTSRGGVINEADLAYYLNNELIKGAAVDVLSVEPMKNNNLLHLAKNCIITPHTAWASEEARQRVVYLAADNLKAFIDGKPINIVN